MQLNQQDTELGEIINREIRQSGPMSLSSYMALCLTHPKFGYYIKSDPLGAKGDFITAPEISQMFGEFIGLFIAGTYQALGSPKKFDLVELGAGRGTLLKDAMRVLKNIDGLLPAMRLNLLEVSEPLIKAQSENLKGFRPNFISDINQLDDSEAPLIIIANEFFDALPIKQFQKQNGKWHERSIGLKKHETGEEQRAFGLAPMILPDDILPSELKQAKDGAIWEVNFASLGLMSEISKKIAKRKGAFLVIDYGYGMTQAGETFQAVEKHQFTDPLNSPGMADLTAHINFESLASAANKAGARVHNLKTQLKFLLQMGIEERSIALIKANPSHKEEIEKAKNRLIGEKEMGNLFKVLCISSKELAPYPFINQ
ncbi:MAG: SAM-dependent methyltransferase [Devosiaceae bacterium]|nr:SAM-dependent methyltransferase [Devosiaceae bacterium]